MTASKQVMYHFCTVNSEGTPVLNYGDGREVKVGETLTVDYTPVLCRQGLHASPRILDALLYSPRRGFKLCAVVLGGDRVDGYDKSAASERTCLAMVDGEAVRERLLEFVRFIAASVHHLWPDAPPVVEKFLTDGDVDSALGAMNEAAALQDGMSIDERDGVLFGVAGAMYRAAELHTDGAGHVEYRIPILSRVVASLHSPYDETKRKKLMEAHEKGLRRRFPELEVTL